MTLPDDVKAAAVEAMHRVRTDWISDYSLHVRVDPDSYALDAALPIITPAIERATIERCIKVVTPVLAADLTVSGQSWANVITALRALLPEGEET